MRQLSPEERKDRSRIEDIISYWERQNITEMVDAVDDKKVPSYLENQKKQIT